VTRSAMMRFVRWKRNWTGSKCLAAGNRRFERARF
jgi:hypothetical protein